MLESSSEAGVAVALLSAVSQAVVHMLWKSGGDKLAVRALIGAVEAIVVLPLVFFVAWPTATVWAWLGASIAIHVIYQFTLIHAYDKLDFSLAYPLARGVAPIATAVAGIVLIGDTIGPLALIGIVTVSAGLLIVSLGGRPHREGLVAAATAGLLTTAYSLVDAQGVRTADSAWTFIVWYFVAEGVVMMSLVALIRKRALLPALLSEGRRGVTGGVVSVAGYSCALLAFRFVSVGVASALRETSVVFATVFAKVFLQESVERRRWLGVCAIVCGAVLIAVGTRA